MLVGGFLLAIWMVAKDGCVRWPRRTPVLCAVLGGTVPPGLFLILSSTWDSGNEDTFIRCRNFYGVLQVDLCEDEDTGRLGMALYHGQTQHGFQYMNKALRNEPTTYYDRESGVGLTLTRLAEQNPLKVGAVGLGVGTLAAYGRERDSYHFYEIDRDVVKLAQKCFFYLRDCPAQTTITLGDARIALERLPNQNYDVLALDAFSGDAIPIHLLTVEAFELYQRHIKPDGVIAVHISNRYLNLLPVVVGAAKKHNLTVLYVETERNETIAEGSSKWLLLTRNEEFINDEFILQHVSPHEEFSSPQILWTDQYSNLLGVLD